jgi:hypothetical protein
VSSRPSTKSERQQKILLAGVLFLLVNLIGGNVAWNVYHGVTSRRAKQKADLAHAKEWLSDRDLWTDRAAWIAAKQPPLPKDAGQASADLLESLQKTAEQDHLTILEQGLQESRRTPQFREIAVKFRMTGSLESLCRWLVEVQQPELFDAVTVSSLKSEGDTNNVRCDLVVARWYAP